MSRRRILPTALLAALAFAALAHAEVVQRAGVRVTLQGDVVPNRLPRVGGAPVTVIVDTAIRPTKAARRSPRLERIEVAINRHGVLDPASLPRCEVDDIQPATTAKALAACRDALVGGGSFAATIVLPEQAPFPSRGTVRAFNGVYEGRPAILAHVYGTDPAPTSVTLPFMIRSGAGTFGTTLEAVLPEVTQDWGFVERLRIAIGARYSGGSGEHPFLSAGCPAPRGFPGAVFPLARATYGFDRGREVKATLVRLCKVERGAR